MRPNDFTITYKTVVTFRQSFKTKNSSVTRISNQETLSHLVVNEEVKGIQELKVNRFLSIFYLIFLYCESNHNKRS